MEIRGMVAQIFATNEDIDLIDPVLKCFTTQTNSLPVVANLEIRLAQAKRKLTEINREHKNEMKALARAVREKEALS
jgi:hypothetical protein